MRKPTAILISLLFATRLFAIGVDYRLSGRVGWIMPDGKVDKVVSESNEPTGLWVGPAYNADFSVTFYPQWAALRQWNGTGIGCGLSYWHLPHAKLGQAFAPYTYVDIPLVKKNHFVLGLRPGVGLAFMTKTYQNTVAPELLYKELTDANQCIGSVTNFYLPEMIYCDFPIAKGWTVGVSAGWYHISNGSVKQPNSGYNIFAGELALRYTPNSNKPENIQKPTTHLLKRWAIEASATAGSREVYYQDQQNFFVSSMHLAAYWLAHPIFRLGGGVDVFYDGAYTKRDTNFKKTYLGDARPSDCWRMGISIQPEFVMGDFTAGIHIGAYMYDPIKELEPYSEAINSPTKRLDKPLFYSYDLAKAGSAGYLDGWLYTEVVLKYHLPWHCFVQAIMKSHLSKVEFVGIGLGVYY